MTAGAENIPLKPPSEAGGAGRLLQLDVLRGVAILTVLLHHYVVPPEQAGLFAPVARKFAWFGWTGVDLFFVLSGFLIGGLLFEEIARTGTLAMRRFLIRRAFKIWPGYVLFLAVSIVLACCQSGANWQTLETFMPNFLHIQNYTGGRPDLEHTWSLAVEEHFYLFLPLLLATLLRLAALRAAGMLFLGITGAIMAGVFLLRLRFCLANPAAPYVPAFFATHFRVDALMAGVVLAYVKNFHGWMFQGVLNFRWVRWVLLPLAAVLLYPAWTMGRDQLALRTLGLTTTYLSGACLLLVLLSLTPGQGFWGWLMASPPLRVVGWIGTISYAIYLWHYAVAGGLARSMQPAFSGLNESLQWLAVTGLYFGLAILLGYAGTRLIERPALALRDRWFPSARGRVRNLPAEISAVPALPPLPATES